MKPNWILCSVLLASVTAFSVATVPLPAMAGPKGCPPGLAKKGRPCIPPGLRKHWVRGDYIPHDVTYRRIYYDKYDLPAPPPGPRPYPPMPRHLWQPSRSSTTLKSP